ncbi:MAG TPA: hypothetical protein VIU62_08455, partial [Chloroflexota bacterium]
TTVYGTPSGAIDFAQDGGNSKIKLLVIQNTGSSTVVVGNPGNDTFLEIKSDGTSNLTGFFCVPNTNGAVIALGGPNALATSATTGQLLIPACAGTPTGTPVIPPWFAANSVAPIVYDTTAHKLWVNDPPGSATWKTTTVFA